MNFLIRLRHGVYERVLRPKSADKDLRRQEFILNLLLFALACIATVALAVTVGTLVLTENEIGVESVFSTVIFWLIILGCFKLVRRGAIHAVSYGLVSILLLCATYLMFEFSFALTQVVLIYAMAIVIAGILISSYAGLLCTALVAALLIGIGYAETHHAIYAHLSWRGEAPILSDAVGYALVLAIIGLVAWLSNREIDRSLQRARTSEAALREERDNLEATVAARGRELEQMQRERMMELERFAVFGRINAALVHDLANPVMAATLGAQQIKSGPRTDVENLNKNLEQITRQLAAARTQLRGGTVNEAFSVSREIRQAVNVIEPVARQHGVKVHVPTGIHLNLTGDAVKFCQIMANLLVNAVESYAPDSDPAERHVYVTVGGTSDKVEVAVQDNGIGISELDLKRIFDPFYSRKPAPGRKTGIGIGLGIVKQFVEQDFHGTLKVVSRPGDGTQFSVSLRSALVPGDKDDVA